MDQSDQNKKLPWPKASPPRRWSGGQLATFPTTKNATPNEFCDECGCKIGGEMPNEHCGNPCGGKK